MFWSVMNTIRTGTIIWWSIKGNGVVAENDKSNTRYHLPMTGIVSGPISPKVGMKITFKALTGTLGRLPLAYGAVISEVSDESSAGVK